MPSCVKCGSEFPSRRGKNVYCSACGPIVKLEIGRAYSLSKRSRVTICQRCNAEFPRSQGQMKFCPPCRDPALKDWHQRRYLEKTGQPELATEVACNDCGLVIERSSYSHRFCAPCRQKRELAKHKRWRENNKDKVSALWRQRNEKRLRDPSENLGRRMTIMIRRGLVTGKQGRSWKSFVPYGLPELMRHIERQFLPRMSWRNMRRWEIDHIVPLSSFGPLTEGTREFAAAWALTNLRPLWAEKNASKGNKRLHLL